MKAEKTAPETRRRQGILTGLVGLTLNLLLGAGKLTVGLLSGSVAVTSDAANNLADAGSSMVTVSGFVLGGRRADKQHPYGHGRYEYIASLLIGAVIVLVAFEFGVSAVEKIIWPAPVTLSALMLGILGASVAVKLFMGVFYRIRAKKIKSDTLIVASFDSFSDCAVTAGVVVGMLLTSVCPAWVDGVVALAVSAVILVGGVKLLLGTIKRLLGEGCDAGTAQKINDLICSDPLVVGAHDLRVHDYGPNRILASVHAEFDRNLSITEAHNVIDALEHRAYAELGIELVVHCDPIDTADLKLNRVRHAIKDIVRMYDGASIHDLDIDYDEKIVAFHLRLRERYLRQKGYILEVLTEAVNGVLPGYSVMVEIDTLYD